MDKWLFPQNITEAKIAQKEMAQRVVLEDSFEVSCPIIGGMDVSNTPFDPDQIIFAAALLLSYPDLTVIETKTGREKQEFPYIPGLLGFREIPALVHVYQQLDRKPDVIMVDGHGISHPRGLGVASHLGVVLDVPTIGVAKSILVGTPKGPLSEEVGSMTPLVWKGKELGMMVRTKKRCSPLIISAGHKITLQTAIQLVLNSMGKYKLPEPTRHAHLAANMARLDCFKKDCKMELYQS